MHFHKRIRTREVFANNYGDISRCIVLWVALCVVECRTVIHACLLYRFMIRWLKDTEHWNVALYLASSVHSYWLNCSVYVLSMLSNDWASWIVMVVQVVLSVAHLDSYFCSICELYFYYEHLQLVHVSVVYISVIKVLVVQKTYIFLSHHSLSTCSAWLCIVISYGLCTLITPMFVRSVVHGQTFWLFCN